MTDPLGESLTDVGLVPVVTIDRAGDAGPLGEALLQGGIPCAEITFRTPAAVQAIERMRSATPQITVGAGTVLSIEQADQAVSSGAQFLVSPAFDPAIADWCEERSVPLIPGVATASEVNAAWGRGLRTLKLFPAEPLGGVPLLQALRGPFPEVRFIPTGGITPHNLGSYASQANVAACGGSWIASREMISARRFADIVAAAGAACTILARARRQRDGTG